MSTKVKVFLIVYILTRLKSVHVGSSQGQGDRGGVPNRAEEARSQEEDHQPELARSGQYLASIDRNKREVFLALERSLKLRTILSVLLFGPFEINNEERQT